MPDPEPNVVRCAVTGKIRWPGKAEALSEIAGITKRAMQGKQRPKNETGAYFCNRCNGWHLTSQPRTGEVVPEQKRGKGKVRRRPRPRPSVSREEIPADENARARTGE